MGFNVQLLLSNVMNYADVFKNNEDLVMRTSLYIFNINPSIGFQYIFVNYMYNGRYYIFILALV